MGCGLILEVRGVGTVEVCCSADQRVERYGSSWDVVLRLKFSMTLFPFLFRLLKKLYFFEYTVNVDAGFRIYSGVGRGSAPSTATS